MINLSHKLQRFSCRQVTKSGVSISTAHRAKSGKPITLKNYEKITMWLGEEQEAPAYVSDLTVDELNQIIILAVQEGIEQAKPDLPAPGIAKGHRP